MKHCRHLSSGNVIVSYLFSFRVFFFSQIHLFGNSKFFFLVSAVNPINNYEHQFVWVLRKDDSRRASLRISWLNRTSNLQRKLTNFFSLVWLKNSKRYFEYLVVLFYVFIWAIKKVCEIMPRGVGKKGKIITLKSFFSKKASLFQMNSTPQGGKTLFTLDPSDSQRKFRSRETRGLLNAYRAESLSL